MIPINLFQRASLIAACVSLLSLFAPASANGTHIYGIDCETDHWGFGSTTAECSFACYSGERVYVYTINSDPDNNIPVDGLADCDIAQATCTGIQTCNAHSATSTTGSDFGTCRGHASETWDSGTYVRCDRVIGNGFVAGSASITMIDGVGVGEICDAATGAMVCVPVVPVCVIGDGITCSIGREIGEA